MTKTNKITKKDRFNELLKIADVAQNAELVEFIEHEIELLERKNGSNKKPSATQLANEAIKTDILTTLENGKSYTITEIIKTVPSCADFTNQKVNALVRQMYKYDKTLVRTEEKGRAYFSLA